MMNPHKNTATDFLWIHLCETVESTFIDTLCFHTCWQMRPRKYLNSADSSSTYYWVRHVEFPPAWSDTNNTSATRLISDIWACLCESIQGSWFVLGCHFISVWRHEEAVRSAAHFLSVVSCSLWIHTLQIPGVKFPPRSTPHPFTTPSLHMLFFLSVFLFLYKSESGMVSVFHHRNRHNSPAQPSLGSANRDQIKSIISLVCAKAFFSLSLPSSRGVHALF